MAAQVDDLEAQLPDLHGVAAGQQSVRPDRERVGVQAVRSGGSVGRVGDRRQRTPMVRVLMAGDDQRQRGRVSFDQIEQDLGFVRGVDE